MECLSSLAFPTGCVADTFHIHTNTFLQGIQADYTNISAVSVQVNGGFLELQK